MAHNHGYVTLKNQNAKPFMKKVGETVTVVIKGTVRRAEMSPDYENGPIPVGGEEPKKSPLVEIDVKTAKPGKGVDDMSAGEFEQEIMDAKTQSRES